MDLSDARVLITGGGSGIGRACAQQLRSAGAQVAVCGRRAEPLERVAEETGAMAIAGDIRNEADVRRMVAMTVDAFGGYDTLINNAGFGRFGRLLDLERDDLESVIATNLIGATLMARESARHFVEAGYGNIINVSSTAGSRGFAGGSAYVASKFALGGLTECWRAELRAHNIRVMQVNPSEVITEFAQTAGYDQTASDRKLRPEDIAHAIGGMLAMNDRGFTTELTVFATNPD